MSASCRNNDSSRLLRLTEALRERLEPPSPARPRFAVLVPLLCRERNGTVEFEVLLEVRAKGISQAGDPCFPGGKLEAGEDSVTAALRELWEELGLRASSQQILGCLPTVHTFLGEQTDILLCLLPAEQADAPTVNPDEVAELLRVPLDYLLSRPYAADYPWKGHTIWGMTAGGLRRLCALWRQLPEELLQGR